MPAFGGTKATDRSTGQGSRTGGANRSSGGGSRSSGGGGNVSAGSSFGRNTSKASEYSRMPAQSAFGRARAAAARGGTRSGRASAAAVRQSARRVNKRQGLSKWRMAAKPLALAQRARSFAGVQFAGGEPTPDARQLPSTGGRPLSFGPASNAIIGPGGIKGGTNDNPTLSRQRDSRRGVSGGRRIA